jgi:hypothetical protein
MKPTGKPKTNWHLVIWPILALWVVTVIYVLRSDWRESAMVVLPMFMAVVVFLVLLLNAIAGSIASRRYELAVLDESSIQCSACSRSDGPLHMIDYHSYMFLGAIVVEVGHRGKFCPSCARVRVDGMFRRTLWGSMLCPPILIWAWLQRRRILQRIK